MPPSKSGKRPCCRDMKNLVTEQPEPDKIVSTCKVCGARHIRMAAAGLGRGSLPIKP